MDAYPAAVTGAGRADEFGPACGRLRDRAVLTRTAAVRIRDLARRQKRHAEVTRARVRYQRDRDLTAWLARHDMASTGEALVSGDVAQLIVDAARRLYGGCASVSVTTVDQLEGDRDPYKTAGGTGISPSIDNLQYLLAEGPCIDALELDAVTFVRADDLAGCDNAGVWPGLCDAVGAFGVRSSLSIAVPWSAFRSGLQAEQRAIGSINLYSCEAHAFDPSERRAMFLGSWAGAITSGRQPAEVLEDSI